MKTETLNLNITFSHYGTIEVAETKYNPLTDKLTFEINEFEGTEDEFHSGTFTTPLTVIDGDLIGALVIFLTENDLGGECFTVTDSEGVTILNEIEYQLALEF